MKLSLPLAVVLALLANVVPSFGKPVPDVTPAKSTDQLPPQR